MAMDQQADGGVVQSPVADGIIRMQQEEINRLKWSLAQSSPWEYLRPHLLFNLLNAVQHSLYLNRREPAMQYLSAMATLFRMLMQAADTPIVRIKQEYSLIRKYLQVEHLRFGETFAYRVVASGPDAGLPSLISFPFVEEALYERVLGKGSGGHIEVAFQTSPSESRITIVTQSSNQTRRRPPTRVLERIRAFNALLSLPITVSRRKKNGCSTVTILVPRLPQFE